MLSSSQVRHVEQVCARFEADWKEAGPGGPGPRLENYLGKVGGLERRALLHVLLALEIGYRRQRGEVVGPEDYEPRLPGDGALIRVVFRGMATVASAAKAESVSSPGETGPDPRAAEDIPLPDWVGRYRILARLGAGAFGVVYHGYDDQLHRPVAIKVPHRHRITTPESEEAYLGEARILASLDHPGIVPVYDVGRAADGSCYVVSKFVEGSDLDRRLRQARPHLEEGTEIVARVAEALHHAHCHGLVHRDVKPANILLDAAGHPVVADFGLALRDEDFGKGAAFAGTPLYMSPEQARREGHLVDGRSDVFSLGVILYELLTGRRPFRGGTLDEVLEQILHVEARPPRQVDDTIPRELERVCLKALSKRATERFNTALDLAEDLRHWQAGLKVKGAGREGGAAVVRGPLPPIGGEPPAKVVPKGLRAFDARDADFFLELVPGPRGREGLPESIRFWKSRVEETDPDQSFRVGLLYGPSGCGKSSLVKAGLLPRLAGWVRAVYVEVGAGETEARLVRSLRKHWPNLPENLAEALAVLRRGGGLPAGQKLLLVLDQFEQWLQARREVGRDGLVRALRQCDGGRVQALLLVRDEFWLAVSRFLAALEVDAVPGHNVALADLFDPAHARKVLAAFGRAFGCLPDGPTAQASPQGAFVEQAVAGLAQDGWVVSVRLALFAEMVKGKPWVPATLKEVGGVAGVGVSFLEEVFGERTANPRHRQHRQAAREVLKALLPEAGADLKGRLRSEAELRAASGYAGRPKDFADLLHTLDAELRLIALGDPEGQPGDVPAEASDRPGITQSTPAARPGAEKFYQLTHDYLVPSVRDWLTRKQKETRRGRAELRLAERATLWSAWPANRHLPAGWEWLAIRLFTRAREWTASQRDMMRRADRYYGMIAVLVFLGIALASWGLRESNGRLKAAQGVEALANAEPGAVSRLVEDLGPARRWADPLLRQRLAAADPDSSAALNWSLALLPSDPAQADYLCARLPGATPDQVLLLAHALAGHRDRVAERLWAALGDEKSPAAGRVRAACVLAGNDPEDPRWPGVGPALAALLVGENALDLARWTEALRPVGPALVRPLGAIFRDEKHPKTERDLATALLTVFAADRIEDLADLLLDADPRAFGELLPRVLAYPDRARATRQFQRELERSLSPHWPDTDPDPNGPALPADLVRQVEAADGMVDRHFALCQTLPHEQAGAVVEGLRRWGYRPLCYRPYRHRGRLRVAAAWTRDRIPWHLDQDLPAEATLKASESWRQKGYSPHDVSCYPGSEGGTSVAFYSVLYSRKGDEETDGQLLLGLPPDRYQEAIKPLQGTQYVPRTQHQVVRDGQTYYSAVWWKPRKPFNTKILGLSAAETWFENTSSPSNCLVDLRPARAPGTTPRADRAREDLERAEKDLKSKPGDLHALQSRGQAYFWLGHVDKALADLDAAAGRAGDTGFYETFYHRALIHASRGDADLSRKDQAEFRKRTDAPLAGAALAAVASAFLSHDAEGLRRLEADLARVPRDAGALYEAGQAHALAAEALDGRNLRDAAGMVGLASISDRPCGALFPARLADFIRDRSARSQAYKDRSVTLLSEAFSAGFTNAALIRTSPSLEAVRRHPRFQDLKARLHLEREYSAVWLDNPALVSEESHGLDPAAHLARCRQLVADGYRPVSLTAAETDPGRPPVTASVWHRPVVAEKDREVLARRQANGAAALLHLGHGQPVWPLLRHRDDPGVRTELVHRFGSLGANAAALVRRLGAEEEVSARRALVLSLGEFKAEQLPEETRAALVPRLLEWFRTDPDPGVHGATDWLLRHAREGPEPRKLDWGQGAALAGAEEALAGRRPPAPQGWLVSPTGHTFTLLGPVGEFRMGSPGSESGRYKDEAMHRFRIPRRFALGARQVTVRQFLEFKKAHPGVFHEYDSQYGPEPDCPVTSVTWYDAAQYCRWLSEKEGIPQDQWCFPSVEEIEDCKRNGKPLKLPDGYLGRTGYRLPTEAEWEYACRSGAETRRYYGSSEEMLSRYAWHLQNARERTWPVGQKKPNDFGLFDMHGNVWTWCLDRYREHDVAYDKVLDDEEDKKPVLTKDTRVLRGVSFNDQSGNLRSAIRGDNGPSVRYITIGLRLARTYR